LSNVVLDASALLALLNDETGSEVVAQELPEALIGAVNLSEVVAKLAEHGMPEDAIHVVIDSLGVTVAPFGAPQAYITGMLQPQTRPSGLSLGDRACIALGRSRGLPVLTADRAWATLDLDVDVRVIR